MEAAEDSGPKANGFEGLALGFADNAPAMSDENVEIVRGLFQAFNDGEYERCFDVIDLDVEWEDPRGIPGGGVHRGHDGVRSWFARWLAAWDHFSVEAEDFTDAGEYVVVSERLRGIGRSSGVPIDQAWVAVYKLRGGRIVRRTDYPDKEVALAAVGPASSHGS